VPRPLVLFWAAPHRTALLDERLSEFCDTALLSDCNLDDRRRAAALIASSTGVNKAIGAETFAQLPNLSVVASRGAGANCFDLDAATAYGLPVLNNPGVAPDAVVEYVLATLPLVYRHLVEESRALEKGSELRQLRPQLAGKTVAVLGMGAIGRLVAARVQAAYDVAVTTWRPRRRPDVPAGVRVVGSLEELLAGCDALVVTLPLTDETTAMIGEHELSLLKPSAVVVNVSRGGIVDETALAARIAAGRLGGAAVDVFATEPVPADNPLLGLPNVFATPHCAGIATEARARLDSATADGVLCALAGVRPKRIANGVWPPRRRPAGFAYPVPAPA